MYQPRGWLWASLIDDMEQINAYGFYDLGKWLQQVFLQSAGPIKSYAYAAWNARSQLDAAITGSGKFKLNESLQSAEKLRTFLDYILAKFSADGETALIQADIQTFNQYFFTFDNALSLELGRAPMFYVTPKGIFATAQLIKDASNVYEGLRNKLPVEAIDDTNQAGTCLAFALPTAAGFHIARATEAVMREYRIKFAGSFNDSKRDWGHYISVLKTSKADKRVVNALDQLRLLHRNPLIHPEHSLTMPEALTLWSLCCSIIQSMIADMEGQAVLPDLSIAGMLPAVTIEAENEQV